MERRTFLQTALPAALAAQATDRVTCDVFVYGSTPGGITAAIEAARQGLKTILACPQKHLGGMAASGLSTTDAVRPEMFSGQVVEFTDKVLAYYIKLLGDSPEMRKFINNGWYYEPSVAELVFDQMVAAEHKNLRWMPGQHLTAVQTQGARVVNATLEAEKGGAVSVITARTFIDGTYEGDLAGAAKVPYRVGREAKAEHGEPFAGIHYMNWRTGQQIMTPDTGEASLAIQAFCARSLFTRDPANKVVIEKPASYAEHLPDVEPLLMDFASGRVKAWRPGHTLPRNKHQMNGNIEWLTSTNLPGVSWSWPEAGRHHRARLAQFHVDHVASIIYFIQNDPRVPSHIREGLKDIGLPKDEFKDSNHWPWQIYVRQGRRIEGRAIVTQHNFTIQSKTGRTPSVQQPIAIGEHSFDVHPCHDRRYAVDGFMEGVLWYPKKAFGPAQPGQIPYGAMVPKKLDNLLVPVALSSTHVAMSVLRMEPVWMTTGQIAGFAAAEAVKQRVDVGQLDPNPLPRKLKIKFDPYAAG